MAAQWEDKYRGSSRGTQGGLTENQTEGRKTLGQKLTKHEAPFGLVHITNLLACF